MSDRFQITGLTAGPQVGGTALALGFYPCAGSTPSCASGNNGNIRTQTITGLSVTQSYSYDNVNRLTGALESGGASWKEGDKYDDVQGKTFGNRWVEPSASSRSGLPALTLETPQGPSWYLSNNQIGTWTNDSAGNVMSVGSMSRSFTYDAVEAALWGPSSNIGAGLPTVGSLAGCWRPAWCGG